MGETLKHWLRRYLDEGGAIPEWANFVAVLPGESVVWAEKAPEFVPSGSQTLLDVKGGLACVAAKNRRLWTGAPEILDLNEFWSDELSPKLDFPEQKPAAQPAKTESPFSVEPGYERLAAVFQDAHDQAALGKGKERHANGEPSHEQRMQKVSRTQGNAYGMAFRCRKRCWKGWRWPTRAPDAGNYLVQRITSQE